MEYTYRYSKDDYMYCTILEEFAEEQKLLEDKFREKLSRKVNVLSVDTSKGLETIPFNYVINNIEDNFSLLMSNGYAPYMAKAVRHWLGELDDKPLFSYKDLNRWLDLLGQINGMIDLISENCLVTGRFLTTASEGRLFFGEGVFAE